MDVVDDPEWRDGRVAEGARLESVYTFTGIGGSNPSLSAINKCCLRAGFLGAVGVLS
jgi:hypothetical protein